MWSQIYDPFNNVWLSTMAAAIPVVVMLAALAFFHIKAHIAALMGLVAALAVALVFGIWYPMPYWYLAGGQDLLVLMLSVDLVLGPVLTSVAASPGKTTRHLAMDVTVIAALQRESAAILQSPEVRERLAVLGAEAVGSSAEQLADLMRREEARYTRMVRELKITPD